MSADWPEVRLEDVTSKLGDGLHGTPNYDENGEYYFINGNNLGNGKITIDEKTKRATKEEYLKHKKELTDRTILVSINGTIGNVGLYNGEKVFLGKSACYFNVNEDVDKQFIRYVVTSKYFQDHISSLATGSTIKNVSLKLMRNFTFRLPPLKIQKSISKILEDLDKKIELNRQTNRTLERIAQAIFKSWFVDFEPTRAKIAAKEEWAKRSMTAKDGGNDENAGAIFVERAAMAAISGLPLTDTAAAPFAELDQLNPEQIEQLKTTAALFPDSLVDSELGEIPEGWDAQPLSKMVDIIGGGTPKKSESDYWGGDIPWFSVKDAPADGDVFVIDTDLKITELGLNKSSTKLLPEGVTIISARGTVGRLALVGVPTAMNQSCYGIKGANGIGPYLNYFNLKNAVETLQQNTHGAVFDTITTSTFDTVYGVMGGQILKDTFDELVSDNFKKIRNNLFESKGLADIRDSLLPKLLSGDLAI